MIHKTVVLLAAAAAALAIPLTARQQATLEQVVEVGDTHQVKIGRIREWLPEPP